MNITKAVITAAGPGQRSLPLQTVIDQDGEQKSALQILIEEAHGAGASDVAVVVQPGAERAYADAAGPWAGALQFIAQHEPRGYGDAVARARAFVGDEPFLHLVGDHLYLADQGPVSALTAELVRLHAAEGCSVSAVLPTREGLLPYFGAVGGPALGHGLYQVETVLEKPTPTQAERELVAAGLRQGHYLCFFGIHLFSPGLMEILHTHHTATGAVPGLSLALQLLARQERYLATVLPGRRFDIGSKYGLLQAQLALGLQGADRDEILSLMLELTAR
jgi:UTP--glucose-1-phosphate uridylyltransferase